MTTAVRSERGLTVFARRLAEAWREEIESAPVPMPELKFCSGCPDRFDCAINGCQK